MGLRLRKYDIDSTSEPEPDPWKPLIVAALAVLAVLSVLQLLKLGWQLGVFG